MGAYTIRELEHLSGIKAHTIRIWEKRFGLISPMRTSTNIRTYCDADLKKILNISILNRNGLRISKIAQMSEDEITGLVLQYSGSVSSSESQIESLTLAMVDTDEYRFEQVLSRAIIQLGFEETVNRVLFPFFVKIGILWQTGTIRPAQEHFMSNLVKQKFFAAIDGLITSEGEGIPKFLFFLPEGEMHELGLLFYCYLAKKRGFRTIYLGQSVPLSDLPDLVVKRRIDYLATAAITNFSGWDAAGLIRELSILFGDRTIFLSASPSLPLPRSIPGHIRIITSPGQFREEIEKINRQS